MTTNGLTLTKLLVDLQRAGLNALNVSLDTLQQSTYEKITKRDGRLLKRVLAGIDLALQLRFSPVKVCNKFQLKTKYCNNFKVYLKVDDTKSYKCS